MAELKREIGLFEATMYGIGIILGAGIYALIGEGAGLTGNSLWLSFVIGAVIAGFTGLSYAELASMFPKAAAEYVYVKEGLGIKLLAFLIGWLIIITGSTTVAAVSLGFAGYFKGLFGAPEIISSLSLIGLLSLINFLGIKHSSRITVIFTFIEVVGLLLVIFFAFTSGKNISHIDYFAMKNGIAGLLGATALVFFAYLGFEDIANIAEETKNPTKILSKAFILAVVVTALLYIFTAIAAVTLATPQELASSTSPLALAVSKTYLGNNAFVIMSVIALFATANTVLVAMIVGSRMLYGMAKDGSLPSMLSIVHANGTPHIAILTITFCSIAFIISGGIAFIAGITSLGAFLTFALVNASLIGLRYSQPHTKRPFKTPLNIGKFPLLAMLGLASSVFMLLQFQTPQLLFMGGLLGIGGFVYYFLQRKVR